MIKLVIIDDSALVRRAISYCFEGDSDVSIVGVFPSPLEAIKEIPRISPDVIICDIQMPGMNGLEFLKACSNNRWQIPVIICSAQADKADLAMQAYSLGAVDVLLKPDMANPKAREDSKGIFSRIVRLAFQSRHSLKFPSAPSVAPVVAKLAIMPKSTAPASKAVRQIIVVGASTGGPEALKTFFGSLPANMPPILVVQHMPQGFTKLFADSLNSLSALTVVEAKGGETLQNNMVYIAPGNRQMSLTKTGSLFKISVMDGDLVNGHRPAVDVLFWSVARIAPSIATGIIFTGMGNDGANGMKVLKDAGSVLTIAQDEASSIVFGMPKEAIALKCVDRILPLNQIGSTLVQSLRMRGGV